MHRGPAATSAMVGFRQRLGLSYRLLLTWEVAQGGTAVGQTPTPSDFDDIQPNVLHDAQCTAVSSGHLIYVKSCVALIGRPR